jgi:hypothetical protein
MAPVALAAKGHGQCARESFDNQSSDTQAARSVYGTGALLFVAASAYRGRR